MIHPPSEPRLAPEPTIPGIPSDLRRRAGEIAQTVILTGLLFAVLSTFIGQPFEVTQRSMEPTLASGDRVLVDKLSPRWSPYAQGDVVVFDAPDPYNAGGIPYVKRIIGLPGDTIEIENGRIFVTQPGGAPIRLKEPYLQDGETTLPQGIEGHRTWTVPDDAFFVLGDNRSDSVDSRTFGAVARDRIVGRAWLRYLPMERVEIVGMNKG